MMNITTEQLAACVGSRAAIASVWLAPMQAAMAKYRIDTPKRMAAFLSQCGHESRGLSKIRESMDYTPEALMATFNHGKLIRFTTYDAYRYGRTIAHPANQPAIANIAYAGRMGNGPVESGDGWTFRAGSPIGLTGRGNYVKSGKAVGFDLAGNPALIERTDVGSMASAWFWSINQLNALADAGDIVGISGAINAGNSKAEPRRINGLADRIARYEAAKRAFKIS